MLDINRRRRQEGLAGALVPLEGREIPTPAQMSRSWVGLARGEAKSPWVGFHSLKELSPEYARHSEPEQMRASGAGGRLGDTAPPTPISIPPLGFFAEPTESSTNIGLASINTSDFLQVVGGKSSPSPPPQAGHR